jgi:hypothetical protein
MARLTVLGLIFAALASGAAVAYTDGAPRLQAVSLTPLTVRGAGFAAHETVRTTLTRDQARFARTARADGAGAFTVRFGLVAVEPCRSLSVRAVGTNGSTARYTYRCRPADPAQP